MLYFDEVEVERIGYGYNSFGEKITEEEAFRLARSKYSNLHKFKDNCHTVVVSKNKILFGFKNESKYDITFQDVLAIFLAALIFVWILVVGIFGLLRIGFESEMLQKQNEYNVIIKQLERIEEYGESDYILNGDIGSLEDTYNKVTEYNSWVIRNRYWSDSSFMWWFYNHYAHDLELIELG